jgi:hypothetical protein
LGKRLGQVADDLSHQLITLLNRFLRIIDEALLHHDPARPKVAGRVLRKQRRKLFAAPLLWIVGSKWNHRSRRIVGPIISIGNSNRSIVPHGVISGTIFCSAQRLLAS